MNFVRNVQKDILQHILTLFFLHLAGLEAKLLLETLGEIGGTVIPYYIYPYYDITG